MYLKADVGDKFVIEVGEVLHSADGNRLYKIKGFNTLIFDSQGLGKLSKVKEPEVCKFTRGDTVWFHDKDIDKWRKSTYIGVSTDGKYVIEYEDLTRPDLYTIDCVDKIVRDVTNNLE